jgi:1,4-dihydroxy-6-naphthoate synthase
MQSRGENALASAVQEISIAHSPDSDDAFMFYGLAAQKVETYGIKVKQVLKDIQSLNMDARQGTYEVSAISFAAYPELADRYALMPCGASMGQKYGPLVVAPRPLSLARLPEITLAIPGRQTTAYLALRLVEKNLNVVEIPFDRILAAVESGSVDAGLIIHEGQLTYERTGLAKVIDLGEWWWDQTGLPLPLGGNIVRKDLGADLIGKATRMLQDSIRYALANRQEALAYALKYARDLKTEEADKFVGMYVNELTVDYGETGRRALERLFEMAGEKGIIQGGFMPQFVTV